MTETWTTPSNIAGMAIYRLNHRWRRMMDEELLALGLTYATWRPLFHMGRLSASEQYAQGVRQVTLADAMFIEGPSLVRQLDNLERAKLIERVADPADGRCKLVRMTKAGEAIYAQAAETYAGVGRRLFQGLDAAEIERFCSTLDILTQRLDAAAERRPS